MRQRGLFVIAALEVLGGFAGLAIASQMALRSVSMPVAALVFSLAALPMLLSLRAGQLLWNGHQNGARLSILLQVCQLPVIQFGAMKYNFFIGARLALLWMNADVYPRVDLGAVLTVQVAGEQAPPVIGLNIVAMWAVWYLWRASRAKELPPNSGDEIARAAA